MHLGQLELGLCTRLRWKAQVADDVAQGLSDRNRASAQYSQPQSDSQFRISTLHSASLRVVRNRVRIPLGLILSKDLSLGMVADDLDVNEASQVELFRSEHRHLEVVRSRSNGGDDESASSKRQNRTLFWWFDYG